MRGDDCADFVVAPGGKNEYKYLSYNFTYYEESVQSMWSSGMIPALGAGGPEFKSQHGPSFGFGK